MNRKILFIIFIISAIVTISPLWGRADSMDGTIKALDTSKVILNDPQGAEFQVGLDSQTRYQGVEKFTDLKNGDKVNIEYADQNNKKVATIITKVGSS